MGTSKLLSKEVHYVEPLELRGFNGEVFFTLPRDQKNIDYESLTKEFMKRCESNGLFVPKTDDVKTSVMYFSCKYKAGCANSLWAYLKPKYEVS